MGYRKYVYSALPSAGRLPGGDSPARRRAFSLDFWLPAIAIAILIGLSSATGYIAGLRAHEQGRGGLLAPAGSTKHTFIYDQTFARPPTNQTHKAWRNLFPENGGFIHHPEIAQNFSGIAVFHQLHCLQALYNLYYDVKMDHGGHGRHIAPATHARHCFDYLRQTLMCHADTNLEAYNYTLDGVTGWGTKTCRDYQAVVDYAAKWGGSKYAGIGTEKHN